MVIVPVRQTDLMHGYPNQLDENNVMFWCSHTKELKGSHISKASKFLEYGCIHYIGLDAEFENPYTFVVLPLNVDEEVEVNSVVLKKKPFGTNYNSTVYKIYKDPLDGRFCCNCQGWNTREKRGEGGKDGVSCSHVLGLFFAFKLKKFSVKQGAKEDDV